GILRVLHYFSFFEYSPTFEEIYTFLPIKTSKIALKKALLNLERRKKIKKIVRKNKAIFIINDRVDIAKIVEADGVHLGQEDLPVDFARNMLGKDKIIGLSTHNLAQARRAQRSEIDYISAGPV
ncbi:MAG: thiamine phosphate synthase, partial [Candidatus Omnitrophota bacterium]